jgi:hypothetical protein
VVYNSNVCYVSSVDYMNRIILLKNAFGVEISVPFHSDYKIGDYGIRTQDVIEQVRSFEALYSAERGNIFYISYQPKNKSLSRCYYLYEHFEVRKPAPKHQSRWRGSKGSSQY